MQVNNINLITLVAKRVKSDVVIFDTNNVQKAIFTKNNGYRPTKATKEIILNCFRFKLVWEYAG